eukprot:TRINITY_DN2769_c0_g1_i1.p1 TRINITY_DN2769_c0_g1~~TRINITY_DN2769_c0_g1_i1.p1  ORF type:complete len:260 (+),score=35.31 TRINITY_DN2769_c0_g1_i1:140-919(+)
MASRVGIVTGGAKGIGEQLCRVLHKQGVQVIIVDVNIDKGEALAKELEGSIFRKADVSKINEWQNIIEGLEKVDYLFINAGVLGSKDSVFEQCQRNPNLVDAMSNVQQISEINFFQTVYGIGTILPIMQKQGMGSIAVTASVAGITPCYPFPLYCATKHAIVGYMRSIQVQLSEMGIKSYIICPGTVATDLLGEDSDKLLAPKLNPSEVAEAVVDLVVSGKDSQTVTIVAGRDVVVQEQKEFTTYEGDFINSSQSLVQN